MEAVKRQKRTTGGIVKIPLQKGYHAYGRILKSGMAFYDLKSKKDEELEFIISQPVLFVTGVSHPAVTTGIWRKVGVIPLEEDLLNFFLNISKTLSTKINLESFSATESKKKQCLKNVLA